jgi:SAM-dependent methyltransferase
MGDAENLPEAHVRRYEEELNQGISATGEGRDFFARGRVDFLSSCLRSLDLVPGRILDFGCGTGDTAPLLLGLPGASSLIGTDVSDVSVAAAEARYRTERAIFRTLAQHVPDGSVDLAYSNGVFHHIPPPERATAVDHVWRSLRPGGVFALWENNPWNPGTRYVMSRIPFDRDAVPLTSGTARALLRARGFEILRVDFLFVFPRFLSILRPLERRMTRLPLGGQYQVLVRRPLTAAGEGAGVPASGD